MTPTEAWLEIIIHLSHSMWPPKRRATTSISRHQLTMKPITRYAAFSRKAFWPVTETTSTVANMRKQTLKRVCLYCENPWNMKNHKCNNKRWRPKSFRGTKRCWTTSAREKVTTLIICTTSMWPSSMTSRWLTPVISNLRRSLWGGWWSRYHLWYSLPNFTRYRASYSRLDPSLWHWCISTIFSSASSSVVLFSRWYMRRPPRRGYGTASWYSWYIQQFGLPSSSPT